MGEVSGDRPDAAGLRLQLLGGFRVWVEGREVPEAAWPRRTAMIVVKLLALAPRHQRHREQLVEQLWPEADPDTAAQNLHRTLYMARRTLEPDLTRATPSRYLPMQAELVTLGPRQPLWIDVDAFEAAAADARRSADLAAVQTALTLYTGDLLPEDPYAEWASERRQTLQRAYVDLLLARARLHEERGHDA